ncbi:oxidored-nitro domain-containing protein isoform, putative [Ixodes scapularis]|uniref:Oxidored-nitro domain-containing protein isoform, putative n=1 Tax=Ixodes scapularis TaxID=6945 RepID=B7PHA9_IXOSC|nr:oxidored-nitro domain-containing protein isoform, putative [Ixodes scapularis]|eukprot:XP_002402430.1 oxidored-nitro domain-containing protein isoform, putative [Ixodes scapularis]
MSLRVLPLLYINLGGEMMYILNQRLKAQKIALDKAHKVITDIVSTMFNVRFVEELFKPQELYSKKAVRSIFEKLTHASIMRLNAASMDKLYDLMTMVVKYQTFMCSSPGDLLAVTLNHLDAIGSYVATARPVHAQVQTVLGILLKAGSDELSQVLANLTMEQDSGSAENDLLELMDSAN